MPSHVARLFAQMAAGPTGVSRRHLREHLRGHVRPDDPESCGVLEWDRDAGRVTMTGRGWAAHGARLFAECAPRALALVAAGPAWGDVIAVPLLDEVEELDVSHNGLTAGMLAALFETRPLTRLRRLVLTGNPAAPGSAAVPAALRFTLACASG